MMNFYAPFLGPGDLVFDVGANFGTYCQVFLQMGASVIAIEPNQDCSQSLERLQRSFPKRLFIEKAAVGDHLGTAAFHVSSQTGLTTMTLEWISVAKQSDLYGGAKWNDQRKVPMATLDALAQKYGTPRFIKIDVEGFGDHVLSGMSFLPEGISFEFHPSMLAVARKCLSFGFCQHYIFNYTVGENSHPELAEWVDAKAMQDVVAGLDCEFGDILARKRAR
jgi:FkbM family methyltransferase